MIKCIQININHCEAAQDLLSQITREQKADVVLISEQYKTPTGNGNWVEDKTSKAAIWACGTLPFELKSNRQHEGFVHARIRGIHFYSCYIPPSARLEEFEDVLDHLTRDAIGKTPIIIGGDFNAWAVEWASKRTTPKGMAVLEAFARLDLVLLNQGNVDTFSKEGRGSKVDITFASRALSRIMHWRVADMYTHSDHRALIYETRTQAGSHLTKATRKAQEKGWKVKELDLEMLDFMVNNIEVPKTDAVDGAKNLVKSLTKVCDAAMPRKGKGNGRPPIFWWNETIAGLRKDCLKLRRKCTRRRSHTFYEQYHNEFREKRKELRKAIAHSKSKSFKLLRDEVQNNPWGSAYRIVLTKIKGIHAVAPVCPEIMARIVSGLFPQHEDFRLPRELQVDNKSIPAVTLDEVLQAASRIPTNSSPGLDGIPNIVIKAAINKNTEIFRNIYSAYLKQGIFPEQWKRQRLVLIPKGDKPPEEPSSYRPLCMLDTAGKVLERIICNRLEQYSEGGSGLSERQFGFRKQRSTIDAIGTVCDLAQKALAGERWMGGEKQYCAVITLDVKNAFNTANWSKIMCALSEMDVPDYLIRIIASYFEGRTLIYDTEAGPKTYNITGGVPQGSVLGPLLWNIMYNGVLKVRTDKETTIVGYADDIAIVVVAKKKSDVVHNCNQVIADIRLWLNNAGLQLAEQKTEVVLMSSRKVVETIEIQVGNQTIRSSPHLKYLGVILDHRLNFREHLTYAGDKAKRVGAALARLMPNIGGPKQPIRKLLASVNTSILMYAAPIWASATRTPSYARGITPVFRLTSLRVCSAFRTVSDEAVCVIASRMPIDIAAREAQALRAIKRGQNQSTREDVQTSSAREWQDRWMTSTKGRWTFKMIPDILAWTTRKHGDVNYYLTQLLSGHGCFREYLYKYKHVDDPSCLYCKGKTESAEHVLMECVRFEEERSLIEQYTREPITPHGLVQYMLRSQDNWDNANVIIASIMQRVRQDERRAAMSAAV